MDTPRTRDAQAPDINKKVIGGGSPDARMAHASKVGELFETTSAPEPVRQQNGLLGNRELLDFFQSQEAEWASLTPEQIADSDLIGFLSDTAPRGVRLSDTPISDSEKTRDLLRIFAQQFKGPNGNTTHAIHALHAAHDEAELLSFFEELMDQGEFGDAEFAYMAAMHDYLPALRIVEYAEKSFSRGMHRHGFEALAWIGDVPRGGLLAFGDRATALGYPDIAQRFYEEAKTVSA